MGIRSPIAGLGEAGAGAALWGGRATRAWRRDGSEDRSPHPNLGGQGQAGLRPSGSAWALLAPPQGPPEPGGSGAAPAPPKRRRSRACSRGWVGALSDGCPAESGCHLAQGLSGGRRRGGGGARGGGRGWAALGMRPQVGSGRGREPAKAGAVQAEVPEVWGAGGARFKALPSRPEAETRPLPCPPLVFLLMERPWLTWLPPRHCLQLLDPPAQGAGLRRQPLGRQGSSWTTNVQRIRDDRRAGGPQNRALGR